MPEGETPVVTAPVADVITPPVAVVENSGNTAETEAISPGIQKRLDRFEKKIIKEQVEPLQAQIGRVRQAAEENGYDLAILGFTSDDTKVPAPAAKVEGPSGEAVRLMRVTAAYEANLPAEALPLITGTDEETIKAQVAAVMTLNPKGRRVSPVRPAPDGKPLPTYTRSQFQDGKFFADHKEDIMKAINDGRYDPNN